MNRIFQGSCTATLDPSRSGNLISGGEAATAARFAMQISTPWGGVETQGIYQNYSPPHPPPDWNRHQYRVISRADIITGDFQNTDTGIQFGDMPNFNCSWVISCATAPVLSYFDLDVLFVDPITKLPRKFYAGAPVLDGTPGLKGSNDEQLVVGSTVSATINTPNGGSASVSAVVVSTGLSIADFQITIQAQAFVDGIFEDAIGSVHATLNWSGVPLVYMNTHDYGDGAGERVTITVSGMSLDIVNPGEVWGGFDGSPPLKYRLKGELHTMDGPYQGSKDIAFVDHSEWVGPPIGGSYVDTVTIFPASPDIDHVSTTYFWQVASNFHPAPTNNSVVYKHYLTDFYFDQPARPFAFLHNPGQNGDDPNDWRLGFLGKAYKAGTLHRTASVVLDNGADAGPWSAGAHTTATTDGSAISIAAAGGVGSATRMFAPAKVAEGYGVLQFDVQTTVGDALPLSLQVNDGKKWNFTTGNHGAWKTVTIYLTAPLNTGGWDLQTWRWPKDSDGVPVNEGKFWGINRLSSLLFDLIPDGETLLIDNIKLNTIAPAKATFLPAFGPGFGYQVFLDGGPYYCRPFFRGLADGRIAWDWYDMIQWYDVGALRQEILYPSIGNFFDDINTLLGWNITPEVVFPDSYHNLDRYPTWLFAGNGAWYEHTSGVWNDGIQQPADGLALYAQPICDLFVAIPDCINPFTGVHTGEMPLVFRKILRSDCDGLALGAQGNFVPGVVAKMLDQSNVVADQGVTDAKGYYIASAGIGAKGNKFYHNTMTRAGKTLTSPAYAVPARMRMRASCGVESNPGRNPYNHQSLSSDYHTTQIKDGDVLYRGYEFTDPAIPKLFETLVTSGADASDPRVIEDLRRRLVLIYTNHEGDHYNVYTRWSTNRGQTWSDATLAFAGGKHPTIWSNEDGTIVAAFVGGKIQATWQGIGDDDPSAVFNLKDQAGTDLAVEDDTFGIAGARASGREMALHVAIAGEAATSDWVCTDRQGRSWRRAS